ncbi:hypothetical protein Pcar_3182 [Syntrophotalea carbinolica DSM 2380]|uniref:Uncharacterized protein n=1 Tax=Syntrophotalea carbinolica (strain DSM 2380 / NBRC 103641 / GraBd1) TaxID=338963 RepID=Q0C6Y5_SYNC1|nr:hypothetical protein Pcar_3182 [Syntrophotalea carbinolica DSM 2380]
MDFQNQIFNSIAKQGNVLGCIFARVLPSHVTVLNEQIDLLKQLPTVHNRLRNRYRKFRRKPSLLFRSCFQTIPAAPRKANILVEDSTITGFHIGVNCGEGFRISRNTDPACGDALSIGNLGVRVARWLDRFSYPLKWGRGGFVSTTVLL